MDEQPSLGPARLFVRRVRHRLSTVAGSHPAFVRFVVARRRAPYPLAVSRRTELVIEGFPRSANSFAVAAFRHAQTSWVVASHHVHAPAQVVRAVRLGVPTIVLIRRPADAVVSGLVFSPHLTPRRVTRDWLSFYEHVAPVLDGVVLATFEEATEDFGAVLARVNRRFATAFDLFEHTSENVAAVRGRLERHAENVAGADLFEAKVPVPSAERRNQAEALRARLEEPGTRQLLGRADRLYRELVERRRS